MTNQPKTYSEGGKFYAVIQLPNGQTFYRGPYNSRSTAYREATKETRRQAAAKRAGMTINYHI